MDEERTFERILEGVTLAHIKGWSPQQELVTFCEKDLGMNNNCPVAVGQLMMMTQRTESSYLTFFT